MRKVVVIDDEPDFLRMVTRMLRSGGYECLSFADAKAALAAVEGSAIDVILTDVFMPGIDALDVINIAKQRFLGVPVVVMSGGGQVSRGDTFIDASGLGAAGVIQKPFQQKQLLALIADVTGENAAGA